MKAVPVAMPSCLGFARLRRRRGQVYLRCVIEIKAEKDRVEISIPTEGMTPEEVNDLIGWIRLESIFSRSKLTEEEAWKLSEEIKSGWWEANKLRFAPDSAE